MYQSVFSFPLHEKAKRWEFHPDGTTLSPEGGTMVSAMNFLALMSLVLYFPGVQEPFNWYLNVSVGKRQSWDFCSAMLLSPLSNYFDHTLNR